MQTIKNWQALGLHYAALAVSLVFFAAMVKPSFAIDAPKIVVFGDSLVAGYQLPPGKGFPDRLELMLDEKGIDTQIVAAGVSGDTSSGGLARLNWSVPDDIDAVILELGANDALRGIPPEKTRENLETMITELQKRNIEILLVGMLAPPNMGEDYGTAFNKIYPELAEKYELKLYPFFLDGVTAQPDKLLDDGMHPNAAGVNVMVAGILPLVESLVEELRPSP